jgi:hypothetical protein
MSIEAMKLIAELCADKVLNKKEETILRQAIEQAQNKPDFEKAYLVWQDKTEWVQETVQPHELGMHRADVLKQRIEQAQKQEPVACFNGMPAYEGALSKAQRKQLTQDLNAPLTLNGIALRPLSETKAVIDAARAAMDDSAEAYDSEGSIKISPHLAASLSLCLDKYDKAIEQAQKQEPVIDKSAAIRIATSLGWTPPCQWVGLTDEEFLEACKIAERGNYLVAFKRIQEKLKEKNTK